MTAHGTRSGYMAHHRNGTEACAPCKAAHAKYQRDYNARRLVDAATELAHMTEARDNARAEVERLAAQVEAVRKWATACATQATDYDEDTEQQIEDGREVLRILDEAES